MHPVETKKGVGVSEAEFCLAHILVSVTTQWRGAAAAAGGTMGHGSYSTIKTAEPAQTGADRMTDAAKIHLTGPDITLSQQSAGLISMTLPFAFPW